MKPIKFPEQNMVIAENQDEYQSLPAFFNVGVNAEVVSCWELSPEELETIAKTGKLWISMTTFNKPLMPILPTVNKDEVIK